MALRLYLRLGAHRGAFAGQRPEASRGSEADPDNAPDPETEEHCSGLPPGKAIEGGGSGKHRVTVQKTFFFFSLSVRLLATVLPVPKFPVALLTLCSFMTAPGYEVVFLLSLFPFFSKETWLSLLSFLFLSLGLSPKHLMEEGHG